MVKDEKNAEEAGSAYDRGRELRAFDESKAGVKGLVDAGVEKIPPIFNCAKLGFNENLEGERPQFSIPVIDFEGIQEETGRRREILRAVQDVSERWGFFQVINHGIPTSLLDGTIEGIRRFHQQDSQVKWEVYSRDFKNNKVLYYSNFDLHEAPAANWRDTLAFMMEPNPPEPEELPEICRDLVMEYSRQVKRLGLALLELISEGLGLNASYLNGTEYAKQLMMLGHYYPPCPEPELTMGTTGHSDSDFLTVLLQDNIGGLQVLHEDQWVDVLPLPGALIVNIGDLLQVLSNDKFVSVNHRVLSKREGLRISFVYFFRAQSTTGNASRSFGPIPKLISKENTPVYRNFDVKEYMTTPRVKGLTEPRPWHLSGSEAIS